MIIVLNAFSLIRRITSFLSKTLVNINVLFFHYINSLLMKKFERFKKRVKFEFEIATHNALFK